jgi:GNAT superfamily N-acetyltransferase
MAGLHRDFGIPFFALVRHVAPDGTIPFDAVLALLASATTGLGAADIARRLFVDPAFRGRGLFSTRHDKASSAASVFAIIHDVWTTAQLK